MKPSIRTFLLINLLLSATLITSISIIGNLFLEHQHIQQQLDERLVRNTQQILVFFTASPDKKDLEAIQQRSSLKPKEATLLKKQIKRIISLSIIMDKSSPPVFQVWRGDTLILNSKNMVTDKFFSTKKTGLSNIWLNNTSWRTQTLKNKKHNLTIIVAQPEIVRHSLENKLTQDSILIMLLSLPILGLLIWIIVGRGLSIIQQVAKEVSDRAPTNLEPVDLDAVPTEINPLVDELNMLFSQLSETLEREKRFAADAAHELRTPLAVLSTQAQVALRSNNPDDQAIALKKMLTGVDRCAHIVHQLLTISRMQPQKTIPNQKPFDLCKQASEIIVDLVPKAIKKDIEIELIAPEQAVMEGSATSLSILLRNLVDNAIRYSPEGGSVTITVKDSAEKIILKVADTGQGIPEHLRERVFERFFRVIGNKAPGSGLGLGIVQQITLMHHGHIEINTPEHGLGVEFCISFPKKQPVYS